MSILGNIFNKIFHHPAAQQQAQAAQPQQQAQQQQSAAPAAPTGQPQQQVDVGAVLTQMAAQKGGGGNYKSSIVDLLKLLDLDSSLSARRELANELNVHAGADGSAEENIALHKAVVQQLAANGGKIPDAMKH